MVSFLVCIPPSLNHALTLHAFPEGSFHLWNTQSHSTLFSKAPSRFEWTHTLTKHISIILTIIPSRQRMSPSQILARPKCSVQCSSCEQRFDAATPLDQHLQTSSTGRRICPKIRSPASIVCVDCERTFKGMPTLDQHFRDSFSHIPNSQISVVVLFMLAEFLSASRNKTSRTFSTATSCE